MAILCYFTAPMKKIDIITTQNVRIEYELANLRDRFLAWLLDFFALTMGLGIFSSFVGIIGVRSEWIVMLITFVPFFLYTLVLEIFNNGQTLGKMALKTKVVTVTGKNPEMLDYIIRWSFRMVDIYLTAGALGAIMVSSSDKSQRMGGILSNTTVVRLEPRRNLALEKLLSITTTDDYEPQFPQIRKLSEQDMLTLKNTVDRYNRYKNDAHREAVLQASSRVQDILSIKKDEKQGHLNFLKTLIKDYIVLTR